MLRIYRCPSAAVGKPDFINKSITEFKSTETFIQEPTIYTVRMPLTLTFSGFASEPALK